MAVAPGQAVERVNISEDIGTGHISGFIDPFSGSLLFQ
jgi:hypothetical protein